MSNGSGNLLSALLIASFAGGVLAIAVQGPARANDTCLPGPKATTPHGSHWYYRVEPGTRRHCWYLGAERGRIAKSAAAKPPLPAPAPHRPAQTSTATPLQPSVANAHAEFDDATGARDQASASAPPSDTASSSNARDQATANPSPSDTASSSNAHDQATTTPPPPETVPSEEASETTAISQSTITTRWPDPVIDVAQQPAPAAPVTSNPRLQDDRQPPATAVAPPPQLLGERSEPGPAVRTVSAPESEASSYSMPMLLGGLAGALAFAGLFGFAAIKFGNLSSLLHIRRRPKSIWDVIDTGHPPPWQQQNADIAPPPSRDMLRTRREVEAQSRDIMEILSRASRGATT